MTFLNSSSINDVTSCRVEGVNDFVEILLSNKKRKDCGMGTKAIQNHVTLFMDVPYFCSNIFFYQVINTVVN